MRIGTGESWGPETIFGFGVGFAACFVAARCFEAGFAAPLFPLPPLPLLITSTTAAMATASTTGRRNRIAGRGYASGIVTQHARHYTVEQANAALEWVAERLERLRSAREQLSDEDARAALGEAAPANGGGAPGRVVSEAFLELQRALGELQAMDVVLRDLERGLVDFPALRDGREVYLCWETGEDEIGFWHDTDSGYGGRQPL
jgi:hypothetical protein